MKVGFIGCGNMGGAILSGIVNAKVVKPEDIFVFDISKDAMDKAVALGVNACESGKAVAEKSDITFLAVKPQYMADTLLATGDAFSGKAVISIAAGISSAGIRGMLSASKDVRVLRVMPNTPAMVLEGAFGLCSDNDLTDDEKAFAESLFKPLGVVEWVSEKYIDAVVGVSGSGPAYVAMFIEAMADGGVREGLARNTAYKLAAQTVLGTAKMYLESGMHPAAMKDMVTSPAGTTIEGCLALEKGGFRAAVIEAVHESAEKSRNM